MLVAFVAFLTFPIVVLFFGSYALPLQGRRQGSGRGLAPLIKAAIKPSHTTSNRRPDEKQTGSDLTLLIGLWEDASSDADGSRARSARSSRLRQTVFAVSPP
ncbi:uncharacterized protein LOC120669544 [Panicum virgatum]|uniref:Uncharacterized protein n=1 Tax=Panicum virgatum TaxID=38727 RepID=A0A8T0T5N4_PANVG|nr:uncharacterized protein LOC120669544 [Panicum virgatum]KAG2607012.1 hypothetical protein PVAP13_4NG213400 [Panicum virgatum]